MLKFTHITVTIREVHFTFTMSHTIYKLTLKEEKDIKEAPIVISCCTVANHKFLVTYLI